MTKEDLLRDHAVYISMGWWILDEAKKNSPWEVSDFIDCSTLTTFSTGLDVIN